MYAPSVLRLAASGLFAAMAVQASNLGAPAAVGALVLAAAAPVLAVPAVKAAPPAADGLEARDGTSNGADAVHPESGNNSPPSHCCGH